jgi:hypothetical protein
LPRIWLEKQLLKWIEERIALGIADESLVRDSSVSARPAAAGEGSEQANPWNRDGCLQSLRDQVSNLVDAIAQGALRSSPFIAARLRELADSARQFEETVLAGSE